ncbi:MAG: CDP-diacylglycerol--serine O-phosphatidyltransferase [Phycisphaerae bacterium]|nr:CDP-diacylglycerol--serine O-phosphatidyltransferase [Phycisphaerae bacterium]
MGKTLKREHRRLKYIAVVPSIITLMNALCGFASIHFAARGMHEPNGFWIDNGKNLQITFFAASAWFIFIAMVCDALDGFVARKSGSESEFGSELDSLSDVISFGMAPAFLTLQLVAYELQTSAEPLFGHWQGRLLWLTCGLYVCCTILRLARFNVENSVEESDHMTFSGLPSPAAAGTVAAFVLLHSDIGPEMAEKWPNLANGLAGIIVYSLPLIMLLVGFLMVSRVPFAHFANKYIRGKKTFSYMVWAVPVILALWIKPQWTLAVASLIYVFSGLYGTIREKQKNIKTKKQTKEITQ